MLPPFPMLLRESLDGLQVLLQRQMEEWGVRGRKPLAAAMEMLVGAARINRFKHHLNHQSPSCLA